MDGERPGRITDHLRIFQHDQVEGQEGPSSNISECPSKAGDPTNILIGRDVREEGIVKDISSGKTDVRDDEKDCSHPIITGMDQGEESCKENGCVTESDEKPFLRTGGIGHGSQ